MFFAVFLGGGLGALLRYLISLIFSKTNMFLPYHTLVANFLGCLLAGIFISYLSTKTNINPIYRNLIITGICGGLTTFSTFSLETISYIQEGLIYKALLYILLSLIICLISVFLGMVLVKKYI